MNRRKAVKCPPNKVHSNERKTGQGFVDLKKKTVEQLDELIERQNKLLQNRLFLDKLPDKGQKIFLFKAELEREYKKKQDECDAECILFSNLTLNEINNVNEIEWNKEKLKDDEIELDVCVENVKEDIDVLKVVASHSGTAKGKSVLISKDSDGDKKLFYVDKVCEKYGKVEKCKERFKPNQLRNNDRSIYVSSAEKVKKKLGTRWEVTEATPPVPVHKDTVMIGLSESLKLQREQDEMLKELNKKYAMEKLLESSSFKMGDTLPENNVTEYRSTSYSFDENRSSNDEEEEEEEEE